jgi:hypothetical protein
MSLNYYLSNFTLYIEEGNTLRTSSTSVTIVVAPPTLVLSINQVTGALPQLVTLPTTLDTSVLVALLTNITKILPSLVALADLHICYSSSC